MVQVLNSENTELAGTKIDICAKILEIAIALKGPKENNIMEQKGLKIEFLDQKYLFFADFFKAELGD